jgi:hypothetical protein
VAVAKRVLCIIPFYLVSVLLQAGVVDTVRIDDQFCASSPALYIALRMCHLLHSPLPVLLQHHLPARQQVAANCAPIVLLRCRSAVCERDRAHWYQSRPVLLLSGRCCLDMHACAALQFLHACSCRMRQSKHRCCTVECYCGLVDMWLAGLLWHTFRAGSVCQTQQFLPTLLRAHVLCVC